METATITAREQFARDYLLVVENDYTAYRTIQEWITDAEGDTYALASQLEDSFESAISELCEGIKDETLRLLIQQMLLNQGIDTWQDVARYLIETAGE